MPADPSPQASRSDVGVGDRVVDEYGRHGVVRYMSTRGLVAVVGLDRGGRALIPVRELEREPDAA